MGTCEKRLEDILCKGDRLPTSEWQLSVIVSDQCVSYIAWNTATREALVIDPKVEDLESYRRLAKKLGGYLWLAVIDTHTHADHISCAATVAAELAAPLVMHVTAPSSRVQIRVAKNTALPSHAAPVEIIATPGHTQDAVCVLWGPYLFTGDTIVFGDTGRDDLPGGSAEDHFESVQRLKAFVPPTAIVLAGHDPEGGRASSWSTQMKVNASLNQAREEFIRDSNAFDAPAPALLKKSLKENFK